MPQLPESLDPKGLKRDRDVELEWRTISYRSVMTIVLSILAVIGVVLYVKYQDRLNPAILRLLGLDKPVATGAGEQREAHFLNIEGTVQVKKANAVAWVAASPSSPLEKGDLIKTAGDGYAKIIFADGTVYRMNPETLIVVEENSSSSNSRSTNVAVSVTSGEVDLATTKFAGESKVTFANATARIGQDSRANVRNDPNSQQSQLTMRQGQAEVLRGPERVTLGSYEQVSFHGDKGAMVRQKVLGPPLLVLPPDKAPLVTGEGHASEVNFSWTPIPTASSYRLRISTSPIFTSLAYDRRVSSVSVRVSNLPEGKYYWVVSSLDGQGRESQQSDPSWFELLRTAPKDEILLELQPFIQHGNSFEIVGRTEPGARVMVNDQPVFTMQSDGTFKAFTPQLTPGTNQITVTAQNSKGKMAVRRKTVYIQ